MSADDEVAWFVSLSGELFVPSSPNFPWRRKTKKGRTNCIWASLPEYDSVAPKPQIQPYRWLSLCQT